LQDIDHRLTDMKSSVRKNPQAAHDKATFPAPLQK
ncbi:hypothetical protein BMETH_368111072167, partial [methanotrophic bacterial endosymbiont of Bathymodiolus sp.]